MLNINPPARQTAIFPKFFMAIQYTLYALAFKHRRNHLVAPKMCRSDPFPSLSQTAPDMPEGPRFWP